ncbi:MAG: DHA2 family efflux MFS transporter permease subunit [Chloroflexota bacterium]|nr:DHA2 family efflux MFS transporter permease subunit [Chloroflexota bacterium]
MPAARDRRGEPWGALLVICLGFFMIMLDTTIVYVATPSMITSLNTSLDAILWVFNGYLLSYAVLLITAGRLGDLFGARTLFIAGLVVFTLSSAACGLSSTAEQLILARVVQGIGGAMLAPQSLAMLTLLFPRERMGTALGVWGSVIGISTVAGPTIGGWIVTNWEWRWIFFVNVPVGIVALIGALAIVPDVRSGRRHRLDLAGVGLSSVSLLAVTYGLIEGQRYDWGTIAGPITIPLVIGLGVALAVAFVLYEARQAEPLMPLHLFAIRNFTLMNVVGAALAFAMAGIFLSVTIYLQSVLGMSALEAGLTVAPMSLMSGILAPVAGRLADRLGGKYLLIAGLLIFAGGTYWIVEAAGLSSTWLTFLPGFLVAGLGMGLIFAPMTTLAMRDIHGHDAGAASGVINTMRQLGNVIGSAVIGAVLQAQLAVSLRSEAVAQASALPAAFRQPFVDGFAAAAKSGFQVGAGETGARLPAGLPAQIAALLQRLAHEVFAAGFLDAMRPSVLVGVATLVLAAAACLLVVQRPRARRAEVDGEAAAAAG